MIAWQFERASFTSSAELMFRWRGARAVEHVEPAGPLATEWLADTDRGAETFRAAVQKRTEQGCSTQRRESYVGAIPTYERHSAQAALAQSLARLGR